MARTIASSGRTLLGVVNDVLDFSKIEAGRMALEARPFDAAALMDPTILADPAVCPPEAAMGRLFAVRRSRAPERKAAPARARRRLEVGL